MKTTFYERFAEYFAEQGNAEQVAIFNEWAYSTGNEPICYTEEFDEICAGFTPMDIVQKVRFGSFNPFYDYFTFDGYANFESIENVAEWLEDYVDEMADYFEDHYRDLADVIGTCEAGALYEEDEDEEQEDEE
jgi:hypothetical protein